MIDIQIKGSDKQVGPKLLKFFQGIGKSAVLRENGTIQFNKLAMRDRNRGIENEVEIISN